MYLILCIYNISNDINEDNNLILISYLILRCRSPPINRFYKNKNRLEEKNGTITKKEKK